VAPEISRRIDLPSGEGIIFCDLPVPSDTVAPLALRYAHRIAAGDRGVGRKKRRPAPPEEARSA
jgi:hypothetical protein